MGGQVHVMTQAGEKVRIIFCLARRTENFWLRLRYHHLSVKQVQGHFHAAGASNKLAWTAEGPIRRNIIAMARPTQKQKHMAGVRKPELKEFVTYSAGA